MSRIARHITVCTVFLGGAVALLTSGARAESPPHPGPFQPQLVTSHAAICASLVPDVRDAYLAGTLSVGSGQPFSISFHALSAITGSDSSGTQSLGANESRSGKVFVEPGGARIFTYSVVLPGCGGACEGSAMLVSSHPISANSEGTPGVAETPGSGPWTVYQDQKGYYYLVGVVRDQLQIFSLKTQSPWQVICAFSLTPRDASGNPDAAMRVAAAAVRRLIRVALQMEGAGGNCGTMETGERWASDLERELKKTLYQPSAVAPPSNADASSANSYGDYSRILASLTIWSASGAYEFQAFQAYQAQFRRTAQALSALYRADYGRDAAQAAALAEENLKNALSHGFGFYLYHPFTPAEISYRRTILEHGPLSELTAASLADLQKRSPGTDPLLSVAVENPDAVRLLLKKGVNPDSANDFGKTPLMYAAQYDQLESARLLLDAGADPNAVTVQPFDQCEYSLTTTNVTALDYAVRYASASMIKFLLAHGAVTYIPSQGYGEVAGYPLDWLHTYAAARGGSNSHIAASEIPELERLLQVPSQAELQRQAPMLVARAESLYASGKSDLALGQLELALMVDPDSDRAIADLPSMALRAGELGVALQGATRAISVLKTAAGRAAAWFSEGLACEKANSRWVTYDGSTYCQSGPIPPLVKAWQEQPTSARRVKLMEALQAPGSGRCISGSGTSAVTYQFVIYYDVVKAHFGQSARVYALHAAGQHIDVRSISWQRSATNGKVVHPHIIARLPLGADTLTVMEEPYYGGRPRVDGRDCSRSSRLSQ